MLILGGLLCDLQQLKMIWISWKHLLLLSHQDFKTHVFHVRFTTSTVVCDKTVQLEWVLAYFVCLSNCEAEMSRSFKGALSAGEQHTWLWQSANDCGYLGYPHNLDLQQVSLSLSLFSPTFCPPPSSPLPLPCQCSIIQLFPFSSISILLCGAWVWQSWKVGTSDSI